MDEEGDELTDFEKTLEITKGDYEGWEGKTGFTLFQFWREGFLKQLNNEAYLQASEREFPRFEILTSFTLIDQAYLDNFFLAIVIKLGAEKAYDDCIKIIDQYVRPHPKSEGSYTRKLVTGRRSGSA